MVEHGERDAEREGLLFGALGSGNADDVRELAGFEEVAELGDDKGGGGAGAEAENHAAFDVVYGLISGELLEVVLGEGRCREGSDREKGAGAGGKGGGGAEGKGITVVEGGEGVGVGWREEG